MFEANLEAVVSEKHIKMKRIKQRCLFSFMHMLIGTNEQSEKQLAC